MVYDEWRNGIPVAYFIISSSRQKDLEPVLTALRTKLRWKNPTWEPSSIILDNSQAEINALQYVLY